MSYKWKLDELKKLREQAIQLDSPITIENSNTMIDIVRQKFDQKMCNIVTKESRKRINFSSCYQDFIDNMEFMPMEIVDIILALYHVEDDYDIILSNNEFSKFDYTEDDMISMCHDIVKELNNKRAMKIFLEFARKENNYLNFTYGSQTNGITKELGGVTFVDTINHRSYINVNRNNTTTDFETLVHEIMHAIFYKFAYLNPYRITYFDELEGRLGNSLAADFLRQHVDPKYADELDENNLRGALFDSYMLYLNDLIFGTCPKKIDIKKIKQIYEQENNDIWVYKKSDLDEIFSIRGFDTTCDTLCYLIMLDIIKSTSSFEERFIKTLDFKKEDHVETLLDLDNIGVSFVSHDFETFREEHKRLIKKGA